MPCLDQFFFRTSTPTYNCFDHAREVWMYLTGENLLDRLPKLRGRFTDRDIALSGARSFTRLEGPVSPCIVLMQRPLEAPHIGVFVDGAVIHLWAKGVEYQPLPTASRAFTKVRFYK
jgi:hypothetical protein